MKTKTFLPCRSQDKGLAAALNRMAAVAGLLASLSMAPALADDLADVNRLVRAGQYTEALGKVDAFLSKNPRDAQMRFLKGVILTEQNKSAEAIAVFSKLTEDYPSLPEPYNNLAVLYAAAGQYDKARASLDAAIRTNPSYATAYENLGDIHAKLASQAYDKALQLDSGNSAAKAKLTLVRNLVGNTGAPAHKPAAEAQTPAAAPKPAPAPVLAAKEPEPKPVPQAPAPAATPAAKPVPPLAKVTPKPEPKAEPKPAPKASAEHDDILDAVHGWAKAWSAQDVRTYLAYYGSDFHTPGGQSRKAWEDERRARIVGKGRISVKVEAPQVSVTGNTATVKFRQVYVSDRLTANTRKTLVLTRSGSKWQIRQEMTGS